MSKIWTVKKIVPSRTTIHVHCENVDEPFIFTLQWFTRYHPKAGDLLTMCNDGYYSVCPSQAFNAIKQVHNL